jgi:LysM repeat protein
VQRNALGIAAVSMLLALLGTGFGLLQVINRADSGPPMLTIASTEQASLVVPNTPAAVVDPGAGTDAAQGSVPAQTTAPPAAPGIQSNAHVLQPNYTVEAGDTLGLIAARFNTSVERIQALNNLADPRTLRIGQKLVVPPAF